MHSNKTHVVITLEKSKRSTTIVLTAESVTLDGLICKAMRQQFHIDIRYVDGDEAHHVRVSRTNEQVSAAMNYLLTGTWDEIK